MLMFPAILPCNCGNHKDTAETSHWVPCSPHSCQEPRALGSLLHLRVRRLCGCVSKLYIEPQALRVGCRMFLSLFICYQQPTLCYTKEKTKYVWKRYNVYSKLVNYNTPTISTEKQFLDPGTEYHGFSDVCSSWLFPGFPSPGPSNVREPWGFSSAHQISKDQDLSTQSHVGYGIWGMGAWGNRRSWG